MKPAFLSLNETTYQQHRTWMQHALDLAQKAAEMGEVPVGAIVVDKQGNCLATAFNGKEMGYNPTAHAEMIAIAQAAKIRQDWRLSDCTLYVTLEPCPMCAGAIIQARLGLLVYGANDPKTGAIRTVLNLPDSPASNHRLGVLGGILETPCRQQLQDWFNRQRESK
ncbi:tRNA adenosine(34) deaminase TadA [Spirulina sp. CS-785/01]|uniref:tRNA adenosine(34) deaminase TadA n=1 Tax=Spirulina sp. CS-785/01 TaxID=3021716 RepID=UPI00232FB478|nr:tRNA adenosine(34) deaminase TadA [Spirulina sp. CS-785/01]MDB9313235.1 tRNA adenosine(34) deaminase TadA [Spirulina sp. CS-785/01]